MQDAFDYELQSRRAEFNQLNYLIAPLRRRHRLHPQDPEALDEEELAALQDLEDDLRHL